MSRRLIAWLAPPAAVIGHGCAACTAGPIGVFWLTGIFSIVYGLLGGRLGNLEGSEWLLVGLGIVLWSIAAVWARLTLHGVAEDYHPARQGSLQRRVIPRLDETDPFQQLSGEH